ncbi:hypothetical protein MAM1_0882d11333 [Mucor ambiguus]|uniref:Uncharacterized protein n=1 Tax=Mucor ambiguus TaxID=91626 RepID=A0A0C9N6R9_9FUNG|nr:hypothetical protein MAM1_0882d11333 [Mucor ambiguus]
MINNLSDIHGNAIKTAILYSADCYPTLLDVNDTIYRPQKQYGSVSAPSFSSVSIFNHNSSHMTVGVKKQVHSTFYNRNKNATFPSDCSIGNRANFANNFRDLPYDTVLCELKNASLGNYYLTIFQATGRSFQENYAINTVYTYQKSLMFNAKGEIMVFDFTSFQAYNVERNLLNNKEHMVVYSRNNLLYGSPPDIDTSTDLTNDAIGSLLKEQDPSELNQEIVDILVGFTLNQTEMANVIFTPTWWIVTMSVLVFIFLIRCASRLVVRFISEYADNLRNILLLTIERSYAWEKTMKIKNIGVLLTDESNETDRVVLLSVNGYPVTIASKSTSIESSLTEERRTSTDEKINKSHSN